MRAVLGKLTYESVSTQSQPHRAVLGKPTYESGSRQTHFEWFLANSPTRAVLHNLALTGQFYTISPSQGGLAKLTI